MSQKTGLSDPNPMVSVITPTYNHEACIRQCIDSVLVQTYQNWELIVIDDGSTDRTGEIVNEYKDSRIRYIRQKNRGIEQLARSYNTALAVSNGSLIALLEGDDFWPDYKLEVMHSAFRDKNVSLAYGLVAEIDASGTGNSYLPRRTKARVKVDSKILSNDPPGRIVKYMLSAFGVDLIGTSSVIVRREALEAIGGFQYVPGLCVTDYPTFLALSGTGVFKFFDRVLGYRRRHLGSATYANVDAIVAGARKYGTDFALRQNVAISDRERQSIEKSWKRSNRVKEFEQGRVRLANGHWEQARTHFAKSVAISEPLVATAAVIGWVCSFFRRDLEPLFRLAGRADLKASNES